MMQPSALRWLIAHDTGMRQRIEALVREAWWLGEDDPSRPVPVDDLAWAVASNPTISATVAEGIDSGIDRACEGVDDSDLAYVVLTDAWPRLAADA